MLRECFDELVPFLPIFWRRDILFVPERMQGIGIGGELLGHEAQFDEGAYFVLEQSVVDLIDVGEIVDRFAGGVLVVNADLVMENGVEADVLETGDALGFAQIVAIAVAKRKNGAAGAKNFFPEMREGMGSCFGVDRNVFRRGL